MDNQAAVLTAVTGETMVLQGVTAKGNLNGLLFELTVEQRYRNPAETNIEAVYTFPLPSGAVLLDFEVKLNGKTLTGLVVEKRAAEAQYEEAIEKGDTAIMLERAADGLCTVNLGNLMAGEEATIRYRYAQLLRFEHGSVRLAVPTVIAPRYGDPSDAGLQPHQQPTTDLGAAYPFALTIDVRGAVAKGRITSPSHRIATASTADGVTMSLAKDAYLDRDFVLAIDQLVATSFATVARDGDGYVALASFCADVPRDQAEAPLRLKVLVDCSGSMNGDSMEAARRALHRIFAGLTPADRFTLSRFGSTVHHDVAALTAATTEAIRAAAGPPVGDDGGPGRHRDGSRTAVGLRAGRDRGRGRCAAHHRRRDLERGFAGRRGACRRAAGVHGRHRRGARRGRPAPVGRDHGWRLRVRGARRGCGGRHSAHVRAAAESSRGPCRCDVARRAGVGHDCAAGTLRRRDDPRLRRVCRRADG